MTRLDIATDVETISNVTSQRTLVNNAIQTALDRVYEWYDWPYYLQEGFINTVATYTTGTAKVTNGSTAVVGVGTTFDATMVGRKFRHASETAYYRIASYTSATSITLAEPYQGTTDSTGSAYTIYKDEYRLAADVDKYKTLRQMQNGIAMISMPPTRFDGLYPAPQNYADPVFEIMSGTKLDTYTTGTLSASISTSILTGVGTSWLSVEGLGRMSNIRVGSNVYTVKSVDSDTQITIYETLSAAIAALSTYEITLNNLVIQLYHIPDSQRIIRYRYFRIPVPLANNYDIPDMPHNWHWLLKYGALSIIFLEKGDINKAQIESETRFIQGLEMMKQKLGSFAPDRIWKRKSIDRFPRNINDGLEASNFDRRWSSPS